MTREMLLRFALIGFGVVFCLVYPLAIVWPSGWAWHEGAPESSHYFMMIVGLYATLGIYLIRAASNPAAHRSLISFTVASSVVHAGIMAIQSFDHEMHSRASSGRCSGAALGRRRAGGAHAKDRCALTTAARCAGAACLVSLGGVDCGCRRRGACSE